MSETTNEITADLATMRGALPLRKLQLIGIMGTPEAPRALLRTSAGQIRHVAMGDTLPQGTVVAISDSAVILHGGAREWVLTMPAAPKAQAAA